MKIKQLLARAKRWRWPWVNRERIEAEHNLRTQAIYERHRKEIAESQAAVATIVERASGIDWSRGSGEQYRMTLTFDPMVLGWGRYGERELEILADHFGRQVAREVRTSKFVAKSYEAERQRRPAFPGFEAPR